MLTATEALQTATDAKPDAVILELGHYLRVYFNHLRRKLGPDPAHPRHLITEARHGYRLES